MAVRHGFFDAEIVDDEPDRLYSLRRYADVFSRLATDGYAPGDGDELAVSASDPTAMSVEVGLGFAFVQGHWLEVHTDPETIALADADPTNPRIDRIVVRLDLTDRAVELDRLTGTPAAAPDAPALTRDATTWELSLAQIAVAAGATSVSAGNITDERDDETLCGQASSALSPSSGATPVFESALLHVRDEKAAGTDGGSFTSGDWRTRDLNDEVTNEITGASLASNQITLPAGTYYIDAHAPGFRVHAHTARLQDVDSGSTVLVGTPEFTHGTSGAVTKSEMHGRFTLAAETALELQHRCNTSKTSSGFGSASGWASTEEIYSDVRIWKVA